MILKLAPRKLHALLFFSGLLIVGVSPWLWQSLILPHIGHDLAYWLPLMHESQMAWQSSGNLSYEFSPMRCLGLPVFANPNAIQFSFYYWFSLISEPMTTALITTSLIFIAAYYYCWQLALRLRIAPNMAVLLAIAWCLQGWSIGHVSAGHLPFSQWLLTPLFILLLLPTTQNKPAALISPSYLQPWPLRITAGFWLTHMLYSGAFYSAVFVILGTLLALLLLRFLNQPLASRKDLLQHTLSILILVLIASTPKLLAVFDFISQFSRQQHMPTADLSTTISALITGLLFPLPIDTQVLMGWKYGNWEATYFLAPGLLAISLFLTARIKAPLLRNRWTIALIALLLIATLLVSGIFGTLLAQLPIVSALHVNPRWLAVVLPSLWLLIAIAVRESQYLNSNSLKHQLAYSVLLLLTVAAPFSHLPTSIRWSQPSQPIIHQNGRTNYCYEPLFQYDLRDFPGSTQSINWLSSPLRDPRCLLSSGACPADKPLQNPQALAQLKNYRLSAEHSFLYLISKTASILLFSLLGIITLIIPFLLGLTAMRQDRENNE